MDTTTTTNQYSGPFAFMSSLPPEADTVTAPAPTARNKSAAKSPAFWDALRRLLAEKKAEFGGLTEIGALVGIKANTLVSFVLGRSKGMSSDSLEKLAAHGLLPHPGAESPAPTPATVCPPMSEWSGETKSTTEAASDKGVSGATVRAWCKSGKLDYVRVGKRIYVAINDKYAAVEENELARLRKENAVLKADNAALQQQVESLQLKFNFDLPDTAGVIADYARTVTAQAERIAELRKLVPARQVKMVPLLTDGRQTIFGRV